MEDKVRIVVVFGGTVWSTYCDKDYAEIKYSTAFKIKGLFQIEGFDKDGCFEELTVRADEIIGVSFEGQK